MTEPRGIGCGLVAVLLIAVAGCSSAPKASGCVADSDCPTGSVCVSSLCEVGVKLEITSPQSTATATNGTVHVQVQVTGSAPPAVDLLVDSVQLATIAAPYSYDWDTRQVPEGSHTLQAQVTLGTQTFQSLPKTVIVDRTAPASPVLSGPKITNAQPVNVTGTAEPGSTVQLYEGAGLLGSAVAGATGPFSVSTPLAEGTHQLTATATDAAGNVSAPSATFALVVDRTPPTVVSRTPAPGATNVFSRDPITVTFSEPVDPATLSGSTVQLSGASSGPLSATPSLSSGGTLLTIAPGSLPPSLPDTLQVTLTSGIKDLAGNGLVVPSGTWSWSVPEWQQAAPTKVITLAGNLFFTTAVAPDGSLRVLWQDYYMGLQLASLLTISNGTAVSVVTPTHPGLGILLGPALAVDSRGRSVAAIAWNGGSSASQVYVDRYDGSSWTELGGSLNDNTANAATSPVVVIDSTDAPIVAWLEVVGSVRHLFVKRWNGTSWVLLGGETPTDTTDVAVHDLALGPSDALSMVYNGNLVRYNGTSWVLETASGNLGGATVAAATQVALAFDCATSCVEGVVSTGASGVDAFLWNAPFYGWDPLGSALTTKGSNVSLLYRPSGAAGEQLLAAYLDGAAAGPRVLGWDGSAWGSIASTLATPPSPLYTYSSMRDLSANTSGVLSYTYATSSAPFQATLYFMRYNR